MYKKEYFLAYTTSNNSAFQTSNIKITENEFELINSKLERFKQYENNNYYLTMVVWSYKDVKNVFNNFKQNHIQVLKSKELLKPKHFELKGRDINLLLNSEIIKTLALADIYLDYFRTYIKKYYNDESIDYFKDITHDKYDNSFSYRFCNELRDYSIHYALPLEFIKIVKRPINFNNIEYETVNLIGMNGSMVAYLNPVISHDSDENTNCVKFWDGNSEEYDIKLVISKEKLVNSGFNWKRNFDQEIAEQNEFIDIALHLYHYIDAIIEIHRKATERLLSKISNDAKYILNICNKLKIKNNDIKEVYIKTVLIDENTNEIIPDEKCYSSLGIERLLDYINK